MDNIVITDIFNNNISRTQINRLPFIVIHINNSSFASEIDNQTLLSKISNILRINGIDSLMFAPIGDISNQSIKTIIYVNTDNNISREPLGYIPIRSNIWKPIAPKGFRVLNNIISTKKPSTKSTRSINKKLISKNNNQYTINKKKVLKFMQENNYNDGFIFSQNNNYCIVPWKPIYGKHVELTESDNPWYKNIIDVDKDNTVQEFKEIQNDNLNESFEQNNKKYGFNFNLIASTLLMIVILLIVIRVILNWRKSKSINFVN